MKILIDNGHGADTKGKRSPDGRLLEYKYTREIAGRVEKELRAKGYDVQLIVPETHDVSLTERARRVNEICGKIGTANVILISIHVNAAGNGPWMTARGWSAFTSKGQTKADILANHLYAAAEKVLAGHNIRKDMSDGDPDWEEGFYILRKTKCPAVLTENLFQDNKDDVDFLLSDKGKEAIVKLHVDGIVSYLKSIGA